MTKNQLRTIYILPVIEYVENYWIDLYRSQGDETTTFDDILKDEPDSQLARLHNWLTQIAFFLESDAEATEVENLICARLFGIVKEVNNLAEDSTAFE